MRRVLAFLFLFFAIIVASSAQSTSDIKDSYITFDLLSPTINYSPRYEIGYYRHIDEQWILGAEVGFGNYGTTINFTANGNWIEKDYSSFSLTPEIIYITNPYRKTRRFISAELFYIYHTDKFSNRNYTGTDFKDAYRYDGADYQRNKFGLNFNYGMIINFNNSVGLIPKIGAGIKIRDVQFSNIKNLTVDANEDCSPEFTSRHLEVQGTITRFNFNFEMQFFFKF